MFQKTMLQKTLLVFAALAAFALFPLAAEASTLTVVNASASQIDAIYISDSGTDNWEENIIEGYVLPPGNELPINIQGSYQSFDLSIESSDGGEENYYGFPGNARRIVIRGGGQSEYQ